MDEDQRYECPRCKSRSFQEAGSVSVTTPVVLGVDDEGGPVFLDYSDTGSQPIWDASEGEGIECATCLLPLDGLKGRPAVDGYAAEAPAHGDVTKALMAIAAGVPRKDQWKSGADFMELVAATLDRYGIERPDHYAE